MNTVYWVILDKKKLYLFCIIGNLIDDIIIDNVLTFLFLFYPLSYCILLK